MKGYYSRDVLVTQVKLVVVCTSSENLDNHARTLTELKWHEFSNTKGVVVEAL